MLSLGTLVTMAVLAGGFALVIWRAFIWQRLSPAVGFGVLFLIFVVLTFALYVVWMWVFFVHPPEIAKKPQQAARNCAGSGSSFSTTCQSD
ncbi:MAG: hypothetical protein WA182_18685 [Candidatus Sulfotelmatobacter sp.]